MAKKSNEPSTKSTARPSNARREQLRKKKADAEKKKLLTAVYIVAGLIGIVLVFALVNEFLIAPNRTVSTVADENISLSEWKKRVGYERAQRIVYLENQYDALNGNVGIIQQFASQPILELQDSAALGENTLGQMTFALATCQELAATGVTISEADVDAEIESAFNYSSEDANTDAAEGDAPTTITKEEFDTQFSDLMDSLAEYGVSEETYRTVIRNGLCQTLLMESLAADSDIQTEAEQANSFILIFGTEEEAAQASADIAATNFLTVWDAIDADANSEEPTSTSIATELTWRTQAEYEGIFGPETTATIFSTPLNEATDVIVDNADPAAPRYYIIMTDGREVRQLPENTILAAKQQLLVDNVTAYLEINENKSNFWRNRIPTLPLLDPKFLAQPTPVSDVPVQPVETAEPVQQVETATPVENVDN